MLGQKHGPLVVMRAKTDRGDVAIGQLSPAAARSIAVDLMSSAARAEYEADLDAGMVAGGFDDKSRGAVLHMVRGGEAARMSSTPVDPRDL